ncbi:MAG: hypothetical protein IKT68_07100, partial [Clostridia bacterium]|nr:hypothetical protein [Clostridia bacterium]
MKKIIALFLSLVTILTVLACLSVQPVVAADTLWGIDVSQWQGTINWNQVKAAGVDFVILRGWCY